VRRVQALYTVNPKELLSGCRGRCPPGRVALTNGRSVARFLLVDDVLTTGATAAACAAALHNAGLDCIGVVTFARSLSRAEES
jgi:predicted amidophosphoribosyltransferase